ncbi:PREDICTED: vacuolar protein-sorting-associated protein 36 [Drosophila arizonae]|uniref:Vacuolar protein-sorting-associated protein 36 n=1 Tax=Drosophila arizonae TaxID=7263 RepID=A0ABM1PSC2_DROAR|nr:PREDICTED: vacuolar protein-sorting-associated protein 36 [Drosophila arizonae]
MGVIYKILKQQRQLQQQEMLDQQQQRRSLSLELNTSTKCKVQAAIRQRQLLRLEQRTQQEHDESLAEQQLQQLCRFLAENAARKKRQRLKLQQDPCNRMSAHPCEPAPHSVAGTHDMDLLMEQLSTCSDATPSTSPTPSSSPSSSPSSWPPQSNRAAGSAAPRVSILLKIRHQIFERKRQRQRQLAELVKQRLVVWRPW